MPRLKCVILDDYQNIALNLADWQQINDQVEVVNLTHNIESKNALIEQLKDYEIIIIMRERTAFDAEILNHLPRLKLLITTGMRNAVIDLEIAAKNNIIVCGTRGFSEPPTELTWALILALARNLVLEITQFRTQGPWQSTVGTDLFGKTLGLIGLGKIGSQMAKIAKAFGMNVIAWSPHLTLERATAAEVQFASSKQALLQGSDFVSIHLVLSSSTQGLINEADLKCMRPEAYLINTSRAAIVDQNALIKALQENWIAGAGLDVYETEPLPAGHILRTLPNVIATPHLGYVSLRNYQTYYQEALENIIAFLNNNPIRRLN